MEKRLSKTLAAAGVGSRRACEQMIFDGRVKVNGKVASLPQTLVDLQKDAICVDDNNISREHKKVYFMVHKPVGFICADVRPKNQRIVLDLLNGREERLFTIGPLDRDTSGLLIVTNDGHFNQDFGRPRANITKEYLLKAQQEITPDHLQALMKGAAVDGRWVRPISVRKVRRGTCKICVKEGKKHVVRILAEKAGLKIITLTRIRIGNLALGSLPEGHVRQLQAHELDLVFSSVSEK